MPASQRSAFPPASLLPPQASQGAQRFRSGTQLGASPSWPGRPAKGTCCTQEAARHWGKTRRHQTAAAASKPFPPPSLAGVLGAAASRGALPAHPPHRIWRRERGPPPPVAKGLPPLPAVLGGGGGARKCSARSLTEGSNVAFLL